MTLLSTVLDLVSTAEQTIPLPAFASFMLLGLAAVVTAAGVRVAAKRFLELEGAKPILVVSVVVALVALASGFPGVPNIGFAEVRNYSIPVTGVLLMIAAVLIGFGDQDTPWEWFRNQEASRQIAVGAVVAVVLTWIGVGGWNALQANVVGVPLAGVLLVLSLIATRILPSDA